MKGLIDYKTGKMMPISQSSKLPQKDLKIIASIIQEFKDISRKDIKKWRDALAVAGNTENPRRWMLHDLYDYLSTDGHLESQLLLRRMATLSKKFMIIDGKTGNENTEKTKLLKKRWFYNFMLEVIDSAAFGYRAIEFAPGEKIKCEIIPPRNVIPERRFVAFEATGDKGVFYDPEKDYVIEAGRVKDLGVMNKIVPQLIWKKNAQQAWAEFGEKFGMPMITATTNKSDKKEIDRIEAMLRALGEASQAVLPEGTTIDIKETGTKSDPFNIYDKQIERCNSEISKAFLASTMVTDNGSSRSQSEVHERNVDDKVAAADQQNLEFTINEDLLPLLIKFGLPFSEDDEFKFDESERLTLKEFWAIVDGISNKWDVPAEWVTKTFNVPIEGIKEKKAQGGAEGNFKDALNGFQNLSGLNFPSYTSIACCSKHNFVATANDKEWESWINSMNAHSSSILKQLWDGENTEFNLLEKSILNGQILQDSLFNGWSNRMKITYDAVDHAVLQSMEYNLFHFSYARGLSELQELNKILVDKDKLKIVSFSDFKEKAKPLLTRVNNKWLQTEYNHAWAVSQNASAFLSHWKEKDTVTKFIIYRTAGDSNVRASHQLLNGKVFKIEDPEARKLYPPNEWGCRCEFEQFLGNGANAITGKEGQDLLNADKKFMVNRGEAKQVFSANEFYISNSTKDFEGKINSLSYNTFKQPSFSKIKDSYTALKLDNTITPDNVKDFFKKSKSGDFMPFKDYLNRCMVLKENVFKTHTSGKYVTKEELRHQLFPHIKDVLMQPDEVYMTSYAGKPQFRYIKMYNDRMLVVDTDNNDLNVEIKNWYTAKTKQKTGESADHVRKGLLLKKSTKPR